VDLVTKNPCKNVVVFTVVAAGPATTDYTKILEENFPPEAQKPLKVFHLRGTPDYKKLGIVHRGMMAMMKKMTLDKKNLKERNFARFCRATDGAGGARRTPRSAPGINRQRGNSPHLFL
jgi:hypothetical protein